MNKHSKGYFTVEAVIVITTMLIALCAVMYAFMIMYQNMVVLYAASYGAQQGARAWINTGISMDGKTRNYSSELYSGIAEMAGGGKTGEKKSKIETAVKQKMKLSIFSTKTASIKVDFDNNILQRRVVVEIRQKVPIPFSGIVKYFNHGNAFEIKAKMEATVVEPTEYIRNVDYGIEWIKVLSEKLGDGIGKSATKEMEEILKGLN